VANLGEIVQNLPQSPAKTAIVSILTNRSDSLPQQAAVPTTPTTPTAQHTPTAPVPTLTPAMTSETIAQSLPTASQPAYAPVQTASSQPAQLTQPAPLNLSQIAPPTAEVPAVPPSAPADVSAVTTQTADGTMPTTAPETAQNSGQPAQPAITQPEQSIQPEQPIQQRVAANFALSPLDVAGFPRLAADLDATMQTVRLAMVDLPPEALAQVGEVLDAINTNIDFLSGSALREMTMIQIPINFHREQESASLYVFNNKQKQGKGGKNKSTASAMLSLNLRNLGLVEGYVRREGQSVTIQFRLGKDSVRPLFINNMTTLEQGLASIGYNLNNVAYREITEKFRLTETEPAQDDVESAAPTIFNLDLKG